MTRVKAPRAHRLVTRLLIAQGLPLALLALIVLAAGAWSANRVVANTADRLLAGALQTISQSVTLTDGEVTADVAPWALGLLDGPERDAVFYSVRDGDRLVTGYPDLPNLPRLPSEHLAFSNLSVRGIPVRMAQQTLFIPGHTTPVRVSVAQSLDSRRANLRELYLSLLLPPGLLVLAAGLLIWPALRWGLSSLSRLIDDLAGRQNRADAFAPATMDLAPREFWPVMTAFNHLLNQLEASRASVQRFASDASHQLRTPLSVLAANLELLAAAPQPWKKREHRLMTDCENAVQGMTRLVSQLLATARADGVRVEGSADLGRAVRRACRIFQDRHKAATGDLRLRLPDEPAMVNGVEDLITEQVINLIDNAFQHGAVPVFVQVRTQVDGSCVRVWDQGDGVDKNLLPRLTDRFVRGDTAAPGSGLGLAIVKALADAQGADLDIHIRSGRRQGIVGTLKYRQFNAAPIT